MMTEQWNDQPTKRPDRYLDWEYLNRLTKPPRKEMWCSVLIQVDPGSASDPAATLRRLQQEVNDMALGGNIPIRMHSDEEKHLDKTIHEIDPDSPPVPGDVPWRYFAYIPENSAYDALGNYARGDYYTIGLVGPPIDDFGTQKPPKPSRGSLPSLPDGIRERAVAIGIIDDGIAFANERFRKLPSPSAAGSQQSRVAAIWLQNLERMSLDNGVVFGRFLQANSTGSLKGINQYLQDSAGFTGVISDAQVYRSAGVHDFSKDRYETSTLRIAHGTHVMDLACGADPKDADGQAFATYHPILAVQLPDTVTADTSGISMGSYVLQGLRQVMLWADQLGDIKLVVNFSYGITAGPKDGTHYLEREIDRLVEYRNRKAKTAVILPSGNSFEDRMTAAIDLASGASEHLDWMILPDDGTPNFVEIWFDLPHSTSHPAPCPVQLTLTPPAGPKSPETMPEAGRAMLLKPCDKLVSGIYYDVFERPDCKNRARIFLAVNPTKSWDAGQAIAPSGRWRISLANPTQHLLKLSLYVQRDDTPGGFRRKGRQSYFDHPSAHERDPVTGDYSALSKACPITHYATLSAIGTGRHTVLVGAAEDSEPLRPARYTSSGRTDGKEQPDISAVADDGPAMLGILASGTASGSVVAMNGTSVAAPQITRRLAERGVPDVEALSDRSTVLETPSMRLGSGVLRRQRDINGVRRKYYESPKL